MYLCIELKIKVMDIDNNMFVLFGEYMGFKSPLEEDAERALFGEELDESLTKAIKVDGYVTLHKMRKEFSDKEIENYFVVFKQLIGDYLA